MVRRSSAVFLALFLASIAFVGIGSQFQNLSAANNKAPPKSPLKNPQVNPVGEEVEGVAGRRRVYRRLADGGQRGR